MLIAVARLDEPSALEQRTQIVESDTAIYLNERPLDDVLKLARIERSSAAQRKQMPPCLRGKPAAFMRPQHAKRHVISFMDARTGLKARRGGSAVPAASILSLSNQDIPTVQPPSQPNF
ncbi:MAG TPA: hypothetical protein VN651_17625 [Gemmatimonadaceae bacterium]|nr:hypothetical protein [Gemmatimonadaceae bacterium]